MQTFIVPLEVDRIQGTFRVVLLSDVEAEMATLQGQIHFDWDTIRERDREITALKAVVKEKEEYIIKSNMEYAYYIESQMKEIAASAVRLKKKETALKSIKKQFDESYRPSWIYIMPVVREGLEPLGDEFQKVLNEVPYEEAKSE